MDLELVTEKLLGHRRALDVPARPARSPRRVPRRILVRLLRLPEREVALVPLQVARLLGNHVLEPGARELAVPGERRDTEVDVAARRICMAGLDELFDELH